MSPFDTSGNLFGKDSIQRSEEWANVFSLVASLLLARCLSFGPYLDPFVCPTSSSVSPRRTNNEIGVHSPPSPGILFAVRDYMDVLPDVSVLPSLANVSNLCSPSGTRLLKLLTSSYFNSCAAGHMREASRIAEGGFGSVFLIKCPASCPHNLEHKQEWLYVVKRIPRERSVHDQPTILSVFVEVGCLELLANVTGVCRLYNYGVEKGEYWLALEAGEMSLERWRMTAFLDKYNDYKLCGDDNSLRRLGGQWVANSSSLGLLFSIYKDILYIVGSIHERHVIHFDIKCENFIVKDARLLTVGNLERLQHENGGASGLIFLIDFGESVICKSSSTGSSTEKSEVGDEPYLMRARGTLPVQSPEMLRLTEFKSDELVGGVGSVMNTTRSAFSVGSRGVRQCATRAGSIRNSLSQYRIRDASSASSIPGKRSDVWSLGCALVQLVTGVHLFGGMSWTELYVLLCLEKTESFPLAAFDAIILSFRGLSASPDAQTPTQIHGLVMKLIQSMLAREESRRGAIKSLINLNDDVLKCFGLGGRGMADSLHMRRIEDLFISDLGGGPCLRDPDLQRDTALLQDLNELTPLQSGLWDFGNDVYLRLLNYSDSDRSLDSPEVTPCPPEEEALHGAELAAWYSGLFDEETCSPCFSSCASRLGWRRLAGMFGAPLSPFAKNYGKGGQAMPLARCHEIKLIVDDGRVNAMGKEGNPGGIAKNIKLSTKDVLNTVAEVQRIYSSYVGKVNGKSDIREAIVISVPFLRGASSLNEDSHSEIKGTGNTICLTNKLALTTAVVLVSMLRGEECRRRGGSEGSARAIDCIYRVTPWLSRYCCRRYALYLHRKLSCSESSVIL